MNEPNVRFASHVRREFHSTYCDPSDAAKKEKLKKDLAEYRELEPNAEWHLETRGTQTEWHDWWTELVAVTGG